MDVVHLLLEAVSSSEDRKRTGERSNRYASVALHADADRRLPLHYAVEYAVGSHGDTLDVVAILCAACPKAASIEDGWGERPCDVVEKMEEVALMEGDSEMVEAARAARRILQQMPTIPTMRRRRIRRRPSRLSFRNDKKRRMFLLWKGRRKHKLRGFCALFGVRLRTQKIASPEICRRICRRESRVTHDVVETIFTACPNAASVEYSGEKRHETWCCEW